MPARRKSAQVLELNGAFKRNPGRHAGREHELTCTAPLGDAPKYFSEAERACWDYIADTAPARLLHKRDRLIVEEAAGLLAAIRARGFGNVKAAMVSRFESCIARLGLSPSDGARVQVPPPETVNEFSELDRPASRRKR